MQINNKYSYLAPEVEVIEAAVESGFLLSVEDPEVNPEQDW